ncbi:MAG TPA: PIN domain-containing protein [Longimicrobium sp.]|jgi:predicted nucleic acid-binding protein
MKRRGPVALLDANVLYAASVRDLLLRLAQGGLLAPHWSEEIHNEWTRNLLRNRPDLLPQAIERTRALMDLAFPLANVRGYECHLPSIELPDPGDAHVLAAAIEYGADVIVTCSLCDFPTGALVPHGVAAMHPDELVCRLVDANPSAVRRVVAEYRAKLRKPPKTADEYLDDLIRCGLTKTARRLRDLGI